MSNESSEKDCESPALPGGTTEELLHQEKNDKSPEGIPKLPEGPPAKIRKSCGGDMGNPIEEIKEKVKRVWQDISTDRWTFMTTKEVERQMAMARDDLCLVVDFLETLESKKPVLSIWEFQLGEAVRLADILHQKKGQDYGHFSEYPPIVLASLCFVKAKRILTLSIKRANTEGDQGNVETFESMKDSCLDLLNYSRFLYAIDSVRPLWRI